MGNIFYFLLDRLSNIQVLSILAGMLVTGGIVLLSARKKAVRGQMSEKGAGLLLVVHVWQILLMLCFFAACREVTPDIIRFSAAMLIFGFGADEVILMVLSRMEEKRLLEERLGKLYAQRQLELDYYEARHEDINNLTKVKRQLLGQLEQAKELLEEKKGFSDVKEVMDAADQMMKQTQVYRFCENPLVNAVLTMKYHRAQETGIEADFRVRIEEEPRVDPVDLCSLFCNLIDNALEACDRVKDSAISKVLGVRADCQGGCLILKVQNTNDSKWEKRDGRPLTGKKAGEHGLGLKLVERTISRYHGSLNMECGEKLVTVDAILNYASTPDIEKGTRYSYVQDRGVRR